jgi:hypothetical protein
VLVHEEPPDVRQGVAYEPVGLVAPILLVFSRRLRLAARSSPTICTGA